MSAVTAPALTDQRLAVILPPPAVPPEVTCPVTSDPLPNVPSAAEDSAVSVRIARRSRFWPRLRPSSPRRAVQTRLVRGGRDLRAETSAGGYLVVMLFLLLWCCGRSSSDSTLRIRRPR